MKITIVGLMLLFTTLLLAEQNNTTKENRDEKESQKETNVTSTNGCQKEFRTDNELRTKCIKVKNNSFQ